METYGEYKCAAVPVDIINSLQFLIYHITSSILYLYGSIVTNPFFSKILGNPILDFSSRLNGDKRSIISFGRWESVLPMDIMPEALVKSILIEDLESMENLGIYECAEEDFALCSYVCQSKTEVSSIIKKGVELAALDD